MTVDLSTITRRMDVLETQNRRLRRALAAFALMLPLPFVLGAADALKPSSEAREFVVRDAAGKSRASLGFGDDGAPMLVLYDEQGAASAQLAATRRGPALTFYDEKRQPLLTLDSFERTPRLVFFDEAGRTRSTFGSAVVKNEKNGVIEKRPPNSIALYDESSKLVWEAP